MGPDWVDAISSASSVLGSLVGELMALVSIYLVHFISVQSLSHVQLFVTP